MNLRSILLRGAVVFWILLFALTWYFTARADDDVLWLSPVFFLPQFALVAGLSGWPHRRPWPWLPFLTASLLSAAMVGLSVLLLVGSVIEALRPMGESMPPAMIVVPLLAIAGSFALFLPLRHRPRRHAAVVLLASICAAALLCLVIAAAALPSAERHDDFLGGLFCRLSIAMALTIIVWTVPGWITLVTLQGEDDTSHPVT